MLGIYFIDIQVTRSHEYLSLHKVRLLAIVAKIMFHNVKVSSAFMLQVATLVSF